MGHGEWFIAGIVCGGLGLLAIATAWAHLDDAGPRLVYFGCSFAFAFAGAAAFRRARERGRRNNSYTWTTGGAKSASAATSLMTGRRLAG